MSDMIKPDNEVLEVTDTQNSADIVSAEEAQIMMEVKSVAQKVEAALVALPREEEEEITVKDLAEEKSEVPEMVEAK